MAESIFTKIINKEIPATVRYEDDLFIAFDDIHPKAPVHVLLVTKEPYQSLEKIDLTNEKLHAQLLIAARQVAKKLGIQDNYKFFMNVGPNVQEVQHLHLHILGGWNFSASEAPSEVNL